MKLVAYFSHAGENYSVGEIEKGNTEVVAEYISDFTGADLFEIKPVKEYSRNYKICCEQAQESISNGVDLELKEYLNNIDDYDIIYLGYPIWWGTMPKEVDTFLKHYDFNGKIIRPFSTHEGSELGSSVSNIKKIVPNAIVENGLAIQGSNVKNSKEKVNSWIND